MKKLRRFVNKLISICSVVTSDHHAVFSFEHAEGEKYTSHYNTSFPVSNEFYQATQYGFYQWLLEQHTKDQEKANEQKLKEILK